MKRFLYFLSLFVVCATILPVRAMVEKKEKQVVIEGVPLVNVLICLNTYVNEIKGSQKGEAEALLITLFKCIVGMNDHTVVLVDKSLMQAFKFYVSFHQQRLKKGEKLSEEQTARLNALSKSLFFIDETKDFFLIKQADGKSLKSLGFNDKVCSLISYNDIEFKDIILQKDDNKLWSNKVGQLLSLFNKNARCKRNMAFFGHGETASEIGLVGSKSFINLINNPGFICGLECVAYRKFLKGCNEINLACLYIGSCHAGGPNLVPFHHQLFINFPLIIGCPNDWSLGPLQDVNKYFNDFAHYVNERGCYELDVVTPQLSTIFTDLNKTYINDSFSIRHLPLVRLKTERWFNIINTKEIHVVSAKEENKDISLDSDSDKKALLIYPTDLNGTITIKSGHVPSLISMVPGPVCHRIAKINAPNTSFDLLIAGLVSNQVNWAENINEEYCEKIVCQKSFLIQDINCSDIKNISLMFYTHYGDDSALYAYYFDKTNHKWYQAQGKNSDLYYGLKWKKIVHPGLKKIIGVLNNTQVQKVALEAEFIMKKEDDNNEFEKLLSPSEIKDKKQQAIFDALEKNDVVQLKKSLNPFSKKFISPELGAELLAKAIIAQKNDYEMIELLLKKVPEESLVSYYAEMTPLLTHLNTGKKNKVLQLLMDHGAAKSVNVPHLCSKVSPLFMAANWDNYDAVELLLQHGALSCSQVYTIKDATWNLTSPVWAAVYWGNEKMLRLMLKHGSYEAFYTPNNNGIAPYDVMLSKKRESIFKVIVHYLYEKNMSNELVRFHNECAYHILSLKDNNEIKERFNFYVTCVEWEFGNFKNEGVKGRILDLKNKAFMRAKMNQCKDYKSYIVNCILGELKNNGLRVSIEELGAEKAIESFNQMSEKDRKEIIINGGEPLLIYAVATKNINLVKSILENGGEIFVNSHLKTSMTPLWYAVVVNNYELIELLLKYGADKTINDHDLMDGHTPLGYAVEQKNKKIVELLLKNGASSVIKSLNSSGSTPLIDAADSNSEDIIELLLQYGAGSTIFRVNKYGKSAMDYAVFNKNQKMIEMLRAELSIHCHMSPFGVL